MKAAQTTSYTLIDGQILTIVKGTPAAVCPDSEQVPGSRYIRVTFDTSAYPESAIRPSPFPSDQTVTVTMFIKPQELSE